MSTLRASVNDYLAMRRAMGFKVEGLGKLLGNFVAFCETHGATRVRNDLAMEWATRTIKVGVSDALVARRMDAVRIFARYQQALDPATEVPPDDICRRRYRPKDPNVFTDAEVLALLIAEAKLGFRRQFARLDATPGNEPEREGASLMLLQDPANHLFRIDIDGIGFHARQLSMDMLRSGDAPQDMGCD